MAEERVGEISLMLSLFPVAAGRWNVRETGPIRMAPVRCTGRSDLAIPFVFRYESRHFLPDHESPEELYDHKVDPDEWTNQAGNPEHANLKKRLAAFIPDDQHPGWKVQDWYDQFQE